MEAKSIGALVAILIVVVFAGYIIAGGITGFFAGAPDTTAQTETITEDVSEGNETTPEEPEAGPGEEPAKPEKPTDLCQGMACPPTNTTCPDMEVVSCQSECDPLTGQCLTCSPDCSDHQDTGGGGGGPGGGSSPSEGGCTDTSWTPQGDWSECIDGTQSRTLISNCGNTRTETRDCTIVWVNPKTQKANILTDNITVDVKINTTEEVFATEFKLYYNSSILELLNIMEGGFLKQGNGTTSMAMCEIGWEDVCPKINNTLGKIEFMNTRLEPKEGVSGKGTLATITFNATGEGTSGLNLQDVQIADPELKLLEVSVSNGTIEVSAA